jgi:hypothetical protein
VFNRRSLFLLALSVLNLCLIQSIAGEDGATLKGRLVAPSRFAEQLKPDEIEVQLVEQVQTEDPPIPENWSQLTQEEQDKWLAEFEVSDAGKKYIADQEAKIAAARKYTLKVEADGKFVLYDVPPALYALSGRIEKSIENRKFVCEVYGQLEVLAEAQEILLGDLEIVVSPIFQAGDPLPQLEVETLTGEKLKLASLQGKFLLINFWSASSPPASNFQKNLQKIVSELPADLPVVLLGLVIDAEAKPVQDFLQANGQVGPVALLGGWNHPAVSEFGLHGVPALWLVDREGKFLATDSDLGTALRDSGLTLAEIIQAKLQGKPIPTRTENKPKEDDAP